jgi:hypothetical protein
MGDLNQVPPMPEDALADPLWSAWRELGEMTPEGAPPPWSEVLAFCQIGSFTDDEGKLFREMSVAYVTTLIKAENALMIPPYEVTND